MLMKELKEKNYISHRLYKYLYVAFKNTPKNFKKYGLAIHGVKEYDYAEFDKRRSEYFDEMEQEFANSSLDEVLKELKVSELEDIMQFRGLGKNVYPNCKLLLKRIEMNRKQFNNLDKGDILYYNGMCHNFKGFKVRVVRTEN